MKDVRFRGYFSKPSGIREQNGWGNTHADESGQDVHEGTNYTFPWSSLRKHLKFLPGYLGDLANIPTVHLFNTHIPRPIRKLYCFTVHFNSLNLTYQLMHFYIQ